MGLESCARFECERPAATGGLCTAHQERPQPGIIEPALEEKARLAGEAEMRRLRAEAPVLDMGEPPWPSVPGPYREAVAAAQAAAGPETYVTACLRGQHGAMRKAVAEAMMQAVEQGLRAL
jgi:hypothetical protein